MPVNSRKYCLVNSSVTHDIAKIDNYSVYRWLGNNANYKDPDQTAGSLIRVHSVCFCGTGVHLKICRYNTQMTFSG